MTWHSHSHINIIYIYLFGTLSQQSPNRNRMCCRSLRVCCVSLMRRVNPSGRVKSTFISVCRCSWIPPALTVFPSQPKMATGTPHPKTRGLRLPSLIMPARWVTGSYMLGCAHAEFSVMCSFHTQTPMHSQSLPRNSPESQRYVMLREKVINRARLTRVCLVLIADDLRPDWLPGEEQGCSATEHPVCYEM